MAFRFLRPFQEYYQGGGKANDIKSADNRKK